MVTESENLRRDWIIKRLKLSESRRESMIGEELKITSKKIAILMDQANELIVKLMEENRTLREIILETEHKINLLAAKYANSQEQRQTEIGLDQSQ